jgi:hypothetical protein
MNAFHTIAIPHSDILKGKFTQDTFAADLWQAYNNKGPEEYRDEQIFFKKTYETEGLKNLLNVINKRTTGKGGDPVIHIQTPFGGGKTHSLIAIMHKAKQWKANRAIIVGTNLESKDKIWSIIESQLSGKNTELTGNTSPGKTKIFNLLENYQPAVILIDELLEYIVKASGEKIGQSNLAAQTLAFMQELTEVASSLGKISLVITLPSSELEQYDENAEKIFQKLQKVSGRVEKIYAPVNEDEIAKVIRRRLFSTVDLEKAKKIINEFIEYAKNEEILPEGTEASQYRDRFLDSYPFMPEVIDVFYHRWGSFPTFQRTRGVLRILSLIINNLKNSNIPYISLSDINLSKQEIRQELIKFIGQEYNSIIAQDITDTDSGSNKINKNLRDAYKGLKLATKSSTAIFMYSFSGGHEKGANLKEIKRAAISMQNPSSIVTEVISELKDKLFYLQSLNEKYFFSNEPNLNRILLLKSENIKDKEINEKEFELIKSQISGKNFKVYIWEENPSNIPDTEDLKLIILKNEKNETIKKIIQTKGNSPRIYCNTIIFLCPAEHEYSGLNTSIKRYIAFEELLQDKTLNLNKDQIKEIKENLQKEKQNLAENILRAYQYVLLPTKDNFEKEALGIPTYGDIKKLDDRVYEILLNSKILDNISPFIIKERYLKKNEYVDTKNLLQSFYQTPGELRLASKEVLKKAIIEGVSKGYFGLGEIIDDDIKCNYYNQTPEVYFTENEIIIEQKICLSQQTNVLAEDENQKLSDTSIIKTEDINKTFEKDKEILTENKEIKLKFNIPKGRASDILKLINFLHGKFENVNLSIYANDGKITQQDYDNVVIETLRQLNIDFEEDF